MTSSISNNFYNAFNYVANSKAVEVMDQGCKYVATSKVGIMVGDGMKYVSSTRAGQFVGNGINSGVNFARNIEYRALFNQAMDSRPVAFVRPYITVQNGLVALGAVALTISAVALYRFHNRPAAPVAPQSIVDYAKAKGLYRNARPVQVSGEEIRNAKGLVHIGDGIVASKKSPLVKYKIKHVFEGNKGTMVIVQRYVAPKA